MNPETPSEKALESPALKEQDDDYPARFTWRVPWKVMPNWTVRPDFPQFCDHPEGAPRTVAKCGQIYECWVNKYGAVAAICDNGEMLGLKPDEFEVVEYHPYKPCTQENKS